MFGRKVYTTVERGETNIPLDEVMLGKGLDLYENVVAKGYFAFSLKHNRLVLFAGNHVGLIPLNAKIALNVEPKVGRQNWFHVVGRAQGHLKELKHLRLYTKAECRPKPLIEFLAKALLLQLNAVDEQGMYRQYQPQQEITSFPRGRILFNESINRAWCYGRKHSLAVRYYYFSKDIPHNRLLKYALHLAIMYLTSISNTEVEFGVKIAELKDLFTLVPLDSSLRYISEVIRSLENGSIPETRNYYADVCRTAMLIVENTGLLPALNDSESTLSFVVNMEDIFEDYCFRVLHEGMKLLSVQNVIRGKEFDLKLFAGPRCDSRQAEPDILIEDSSGNYLPLEVKYKSNPDRGDINQAITYGLACNSSKTVLVCYSEQVAIAGWQYMGTVGSRVELWVYHFYLESANIQVEEEEFVESITNMLQGRVTPNPS